MFYDHMGVTLSAANEFGFSLNCMADQSIDCDTTKTREQPIKLIEFFCPKKCLSLFRQHL